MADESAPPISENAAAIAQSIHPNPDVSRSEATTPPSSPSPAPQKESDAPAPGSLAEHETHFEDRDEQTGRFKPRHRAKSQHAGPQDVPRIAELTRKLREAEAERDRLKGNGHAPQQTAPPLPPRPPQQPAQAFTPVPAAKDDPEPTPDGFDDYSKYVKAQARWEAREAIRETSERHGAWQRQQAQQQEAQRLQQTWQQRVQAATAKYPDFVQVALQTDTPIPQGSLIDAWILEHKSGPDVLYHLHKSPGEVHRLLALPMLDQVEELTLLGQRLSGSASSSAAAVTTGAAPGPIVSPVTRPPTPVRTASTLRTPDAPGDDSSLSAHEQYFVPANRRR